jgi:hypothetical protein
MLDDTCHHPFWFCIVADVEYSYRIITAEAINEPAQYLERKNTCMGFQGVVNLPTGEVNR